MLSPMNKRLLHALQGTNNGRPPVWLMRQAGRYQKEYRAIKESYSFLEMVHTPEIAAEVTMLPIKQFGMDAAILFSDILTVAEAFGVGLRFEGGVGPVIDRPIMSRADIPQQLGDLSYVGDAIKLLLPELDVPLIGFAGAPFTVASYMIEGGSSRDLKNTKKWMLKDPEGFHMLLETLTEATISYLRLQADAGVQALQLFDSWAMHLSFPHFEEFSLRYMKKIADGLNRDLPMILFCRGSSVFAPEMASIGCGIGLDWNCSLPQMRQKIPHLTLQGNLDPFVLYAPHETIRKEVTNLLDAMNGDPAYIFNLGHGISPDMSVDAVRCLVDTVKEWSPNNDCRAKEQRRSETGDCLLSERTT